MRKMYDAIGITNIPGGGDATGFYLGGRDAYRTWPLAEVLQIKTRWRLPIYVVSHPNGNADGLACGTDAVSLAKRATVPEGVCIALDFETARDEAFTSAFDSVLTANGYKTLLYGSASTVLENPKPSGGYWVAQWDNDSSLPAGWAAKQYASAANYDTSIIGDTTPLWDTQGETEMQCGLMTPSTTIPTPIPIKPGSVSKLVLLADNGYQGAPPVKIRVAECHGPAGWIVSTVMVDSHAGATTYELKDPGACVGLSVVYAESNFAEVGCLVY
jgi:hypothetical protein